MSRLLNQSPTNVNVVLLRCVVDSVQHPQRHWTCHRQVTSGANALRAAHEAARKLQRTDTHLGQSKQGCASAGHTQQSPEVGRSSA